MRQVSRWMCFLDRCEAQLRTRGSVIALGGMALMVFTALGALYGGGTPGDLDVIGTALLMATAILISVVTTGVISEEVRSGVTLLWIQRPGSMVGLYLGRLCEVVLLACLLSLALAGGQAVVLGVLGAEWTYFLRTTVPSVVPLVILVGALTWTISSGVSQGDGAVALLLIPTWILGGTLLRTQDGVAGTLGTLLLELAPPLDLLAALADWGRGMDGPSALALLHFGGWVAGVLALGAFVLALRLRRPFPREHMR